MKMGILTREEDLIWLVEIREKWYFRKEKEIQEASKYMLEIKAAFQVGSETIDDHIYYTMEFKDCKVRVGDLKTLFEVYENLCRLKQKYGHKPDAS